MAELTLLFPNGSTEITHNIHEKITHINICFNVSEALFARDGGDMHISFYDDSKLILKEFFLVYSASFMPNFLVNDEIMLADNFFSVVAPHLMPSSEFAKHISSEELDFFSQDFDFHSPPSTNQSFIDSVADFNAEEENNDFMFADDSNYLAFGLEDSSFNQENETSAIFSSPSKKLSPYADEEDEEENVILGNVNSMTIDDLQRKNFSEDAENDYEDVLDLTKGKL